MRGNLGMHTWGWGVMRAVQGHLQGSLIWFLTNWLASLRPAEGDALPSSPPTVVCDAYSGAGVGAFGRPLWGSCLQGQFLSQPRRPVF